MKISDSVAEYLCKTLGQARTLRPLWVTISWEWTRLLRSDWRYPPISFVNISDLNLQHFALTHRSMKYLQIFLHTALCFLIIGSSNSFAAEPKDKTETIVLLHGLGRTAKSMAYMEERLMAAGYTVYNYDYESRKNEIRYLVDDLQKYLEVCCLREGTSLHFVTHSLGGILIRALLAEKRPDNLGRVVMLSPPNKGSEAADYIRDYSLFTNILGPASMQLGTDPESIPNQLGPAYFELGIIAGDRTIDPISSWIIPGKDDGKVAVERTKLEGMTDFLVIPVSHAYIMQNPEVVDEVIHFLQQGKFSRSELLPAPDKKISHDP